MTLMGSVAVISVLAAVAVVAGPFLPSLKKSPVGVAARADWVNRLMRLAEDASDAGMQEVADASRNLIDAIVDDMRKPS